THAAIRVRDTGIGLAPEMLTRIFGLFSQVDPTLDRTRGGLGIGLTLVQRLVEMHHGTVEARSEGPGKGSEFVVRLPLLKQEGGTADGRLPGPESLPLHPSSAIPPGPPRRVLVIEDNSDARETLRELLELWGHEVEVARDGREELQRIRDL